MRPSERPADGYRPEYARMAYILYYYGYTDGRVAQVIGVSRTKWGLWCQAHPELQDAKKLGKQAPDALVVEKLFRLAMGYDYEEKTFIDGVVKKVVIKHVQPNVVAQIFWLKNRDPGRWSDVYRSENTFPEGPMLVLNTVEDVGESVPGVKINRLKADKLKRLCEAGIGSSPRSVADIDEVSQMEA